MAQSTPTRLTLDDVRASAKRIQGQAEKLVDQLRKDARSFVARAPVKSLADARKRAEQIVRDLDAQREKVRGMVIDQVMEVVSTARKTLGVASAADLTALTRRVSHLEHHPADAKLVASLTDRVADLERRLDSLRKTAAA